MRRSLAGIVAVVLLLWGAPAYSDEVRSKQWHLKFLNVEQAQQYSQGEGVTVGVVDTGVQAHPDLAGSLLPGVDLVSPPGDGTADRDGHGTAMAGLIAAHGSGSGALGIAPKAKILPIRNGDRGYESGSGADIAAGIREGVQRGVKVLCIAEVGGGIRVLEDAVNEALRADIVVVAGVGNSGSSTSVSYPAAFPGVVAAAGVDENGSHADVSATGKEVVLAAPATKVWSTELGGKYGSGTGTSNSTALIAGVAALVRSKYPNLSAVEVVNRMTATAIDKGAPGRDSEYGFGIVDPVGALTKKVASPSASSSSGPTGPEPEASSTGSSKRLHAMLVLALLAAALLVAVGGVAVVVVFAVRRTRR